jgi:hypothetical protein
VSPPATVAQTDEPAPFTMEPFDSNTPNVARVYDFLLGGKDNFASDRQFAERLAHVVPDVQQNVRYNRDFLGRAVRHLAGDLGIRQFLDIGTGLPTRNNVHEAAQRIAPQSRTVYTDLDPVVVSHGQALLNDGQTTAFIAEDVRRPGAILSCPEFTRLINLKKPVGIVLAGLLHFVPDHDDPYGAVIWLKEALATGSALVISHAVTTEETDLGQGGDESREDFGVDVGRGVVTQAAGQPCGGQPQPRQGQTGGGHDPRRAAAASAAYQLRPHRVVARFGQVGQQARQLAQPDQAAWQPTAERAAVECRLSRAFSE